MKRQERWTMQALYAGLILAAAIALAGCPEEAAVEQQQVEQQQQATDFHGTWRGTLLEATSGNFGEVEATIEQNGDQVTGSWLATFHTLVNGGTIDGAISANGGGADFDLVSAISGFCNLHVTLVLRGEEASGNYTTEPCGGFPPSIGTIRIFRDGPDGSPRYRAELPATPGQIGLAMIDGKPVVTWSMIDNATGYTVYWSSDPGAEPADADGRATRVTPPWRDEQYTDAGERYYFVTADNSAGASDRSAAVSVDGTVVIPEPPGATLPELTVWKNVTYTGHTAQLDLRHWVDESGTEQWSVRGWGFCTPTYCDWGTVSARRLNTGELYAIWNFGWKTTEMWATLPTTAGGRLTTTMWNDFAPWDGRTDYGRTEQFDRLP